MYVALFADDEPLELADYEAARQWLWLTVKDMKRLGYLPGWRALALREKIENMPYAGLSFFIDSVGLVKAEKINP